MRCFSIFCILSPPAGRRDRTRCDPYTNRLLTGSDYHHCCHSNLARALAAAKGLDAREAEAAVHDVLNVFMCTGFTRDTHQYFMKASPVRPGDFIEFSLRRSTSWARFRPARAAIAAPPIPATSRRATH
jgi:Domain of unknown function (DUF1989)